MLLGLYTSILDSENRLALPDGVQEAFKNGIYITRGFDRSIMMLTIQAFEAIYDRIAAMNIADPTARLMSRLMLGAASRSMISADGKVTIPDSLNQYANLDQDVVIVGQGDYMELWSQQEWKRQEEQIMNLDANQFSTLNITTR